MQNEKIRMASAWQCANLLQSDEYHRAATESAILFQPRKQCGGVIFIISSGGMTGIIGGGMIVGIGPDERAFAAWMWANRSE